MNWQDEAMRYEPLKAQDLYDFAAAEPKQEAVDTYNRAVSKLRSGNGDVAGIALRQLAAQYPDFAEAGLLCVCCQMRWGDRSSALQILQRYSQAGYLTEDESFKTERYLAAVNSQPALASDDPGAVVVMDRQNLKRDNARPPRLLRQADADGGVEVASVSEQEAFLREHNLNLKKHHYVASRSSNLLIKWLVTLLIILLLIVLLLVVFLLLPQGGQSAATTVFNGLWQVILPAALH
ncbi:MAG: hypothetical protein PHR21_06045 [Oscillospiraceae bacterium]|nr:hypothetical protein [Oscillospiraceae bacterium]MDD4368942.1 hypothetical protein [Oscillospiraceae bacterium]